jgi:hypothetical protein
MGPSARRPARLGEREKGRLGRLCLVAGAARGRRKPLIVVCSNQLRYSYPSRRYSYPYRRYSYAYRRYSYAYRRYSYPCRRYSYPSRRAAQAPIRFGFVCLHGCAHGGLLAVTTSAVLVAQPEHMRRSIYRIIRIITTQRRDVMGRRQIGVRRGGTGWDGTSQSLA